MSPDRGEICHLLLYNLKMLKMQNTLTYRFLEAIRQQTIIIVIPGPKIQDKILEIVETAAVPCEGESLLISLGDGNCYEIYYGRWCHKEISTETATLLIDFLRETLVETPDQVEVYGDTFHLLTPDASIRNYVTMVDE